MSERHDGRDHQSPFDALLAGARTDPDAAAGLALAYADLAPLAREKLIEVLAQDAPGPEVLALMLGVEDSPALAAQIATLLAGVLGRREAARRGADRGFVWGEQARGGAAVVRQLHDGFVEGFSVRWGERDVEVDAVPLARADELDALRRRLAVPDAAERTSAQLATDALAEGLWRLRQRRGSLPDELRPIAALLDPIA